VGGPADQGVADRRGLLVDLLQHEVLEPGLLGLGHVPLDLHRLAPELGALEVDERDPVGAQADDLPLLQGDHGTGPRQHGGDVRRQEVLALAEADDEGARYLRPDHGSGLVAPQGHDRVGPRELEHRAPHGLGEVARVADEFLDQVGDAFGVGVRHEPVAVLLQPGPEVVEVLDDAVVDHGDAPLAVEVGVGVRVVRNAVRGPPGVSHAHDRRWDLDLVQGRLEVGELAGPLHHREAPVEHGDAGRVVPPVLEPLQPLEDDGERLVRADVTHDSAHGRTPDASSARSRRGERSHDSNARSSDRPPGRRNPCVPPARAP
jgi:hypothetical protein